MAHASAEKIDASEGSLYLRARPNSGEKMAALTVDLSSFLESSIHTEIINKREREISEFAANLQPER